MTRLRLRLPPWTSSPGFGVVVLLVLAAILIANGEPQPSSRPSGTSVRVSGSPTAPAAVPALLVIRAGTVESRQSTSVRRVPLPPAARPLSVMTGRGLSVVLAALDGRQRAYAVQPNLTVRDLGPADAVITGATGRTAVLVETGLTEPGRLVGGASASASGSSTASRTASASPSPTGPPDLRDFAVRRYDATGRPISFSRFLPTGARMAADTAVGLVVWKPVNRVFDNGVALEPLSAAATLIRPDNSLRELGPVHPLTADAENLLVWDVAVRRFGLMPLRYANSTATSTASPSTSSSRPASSRPPSATGSSSPSASASPTTVAGVRWFQPTRGISVVTGPASFDPDGSAFAVYAQVGSRRRLMVAQLQNLGTDRVEVLALVQPPAPSSRPVRSSQPATSGQSGPTVTVSGSSTVGVTGSAASSTASGGPSASSGSATPSIPALQPDGFPIEAPLRPLWWNGQVVALGADATVVGYRPGTNQASLLDLGPDDLHAIAEMP
ncbi:MAG TPA: hypothetical protein VGB75_03825 [Jatrophihabitans sp.]|jgi:hypothetical protein|uniref:hypothetical protein n=1 Tax=Jatrophihabitans sp. TaxID=1932789 RepID=UPI002F0DA8DB